MVFVSPASSITFVKPFNSFTGRSGVIAFAGGFHGRTLLGMASIYYTACSLDGFIAGQVGLFDSIRQLARSVPGSGVLA